MQYLCFTSVFKLQREGVQQWREDVCSLEILQGEISSSIWLLLVGPEVDRIVDDGDTREKKFLTLVIEEKKIYL